MPPRFHPRDFMVDPDQFREDPDALWEAGTNFAETCQIAAAYSQHLASLEVRRGLSERGQTAEWLAGQLGQNATQVRRKLDGDYPALAEDIIAPEGRVQHQCHLNDPVSVPTQVGRSAPSCREMTDDAGGGHARSRGPTSPTPRPAVRRQ